jgi:pilus assembly protein Flp/PilA
MLSPDNLEDCTMLACLLKSDHGATAVEYGLVAALISLACIIGFLSLGLNLVDVFDSITAALR